jgi:hypothetical protein
MTSSGRNKRPAPNTSQTTARASPPHRVSESRVSQDHPPFSAVIMSKVGRRAAATLNNMPAVSAPPAAHQIAPRNSRQVAVISAPLSVSVSANDVAIDTPTAPPKSSPPAPTTPHRSRLDERADRDQVRIGLEDPTGQRLADLLRDVRILPYGVGVAGEPCAVDHFVVDQSGKESRRQQDGSHRDEDAWSTKIHSGPFVGAGATRTCGQSSGYDCPAGPYSRFDQAARTSSSAWAAVMVSRV